LVNKVNKEKLELLDQEELKEYEAAKVYQVHLVIQDSQVGQDQKETGESLVVLGLKEKKDQE